MQFLFVAAENGHMQFDDRKAFPNNNNNCILIEALKVKIDFAFELTRTIKAEKESKKG